MSGVVGLGFLSLEEIDESEYGFIGGIPDLEVGNKKKKNLYTDLKSKKRKRGEENGGSDGSCVVDADEGEEEAKSKTTKKKKKSRRKKRKGVSDESGEPKGESTVEGRDKSTSS